MNPFLSFAAKIYSSLVKIILILLIGFFAYLLHQGGQSPGVDTSEQESEEQVNISIAKTQMATEGQTLKINQYIHLSVYVPKADSKELMEKVNINARVVSQNEGFIVVSVPSGEAGLLEESLITDGARLAYHEITPPEPSKPSPSPSPTPTLQVTAIPSPVVNAVQLKIPVQEVQGGIISLDTGMTVQLVIVERLVIYPVDSKPVSTLEPTVAAVEACALVMGFMVEDKNGMVSKEAEPLSHILLEIPVFSASEITRALTNASAVYLLPIDGCHSGTK